MLNGYPWPSLCTFTFLLECLSWSSWGHLKLFLLTHRTASCKTFLTTTQTCQDKLPAVLAGTKFILVPPCPTVSACWKEGKKKTTKHVKTHTAPSDPHAESFLWHQEAEISFKWLSCCLPALFSKNILHFQASDFNVKKKKSHLRTRKKLLLPLVQIGHDQTCDCSTAS